MRVLTGSQMKQVEENALAYDLTYARLMENAGSAAAAFIRRTFNIQGLNCMVFCGRGNNGGDGFVVARKLYENGANVVIVLVDGPPVSEEARGMLEMAEHMELPLFSMPQDVVRITACVQQSDIIVDAIYGTGFHGDMQGNARAAGELIADAIAAVISLDIPSGVECDTGAVGEGAVKADFTVAFDSNKPLHLIPSGLEYCGRVEVLDIGIPEEAHAGIRSRFEEITPDMVFEALPRRERDAHKGDFGRLLAVCGSGRYRGAAALSVLGALRGGVGICCLASVEPVCAAVSAKLYEPVLLPLPCAEHGGISARGAVPLLAEEMEKATAILIGCGLGDTDDTRELLEWILRNARVPVIIDADGINALQGNIHVLQEADVPVILTPHPGEMARLCGTDTASVQSDRIGCAIDFASKKGVTLVLKGHETLIAAPDGSMRINKTGGPGLAKGGSGDVLAGLLGAFAARGIAPLEAASCAVWLHGLAGSRCAARLSEYAMLPSELAEELCEILLSSGR